MTQQTATQPTRKLPDNADPAVDYTTAASRPGTLRGSATLDIQTRQAQRLVYGRQRTEDKEQIIGLVRFALNMKRIWSAAGRDDPYADWSLLRIETSLTQARVQIALLQQQTEALLAHATPGVSIEIAQSLQPVRVPLQFANAYGYMGAYLIADFDRLVRTSLTARHVGIVTRGVSAKQLNDASRMIRHAFFLSALWRFTLVTRDDVRANNPKAIKAHETMLSMGVIPAGVLEGTERAVISPEIRVSTSDTIDDDDEVDNSSIEETR